MSKSSPHSDSSSSSSSESLSSLSSLKTPEEIAHEVFLMRLTDPNSSIPGSLNKIELAYIPNEKKPTEIGELTFRFDSSTLKDKFMDMMKEAGLLNIFTSQSDLSVSVVPSKDKAKEPGAYIAQNGEVAINFGKENNAKAFKQKIFGSSLQGIAVIYEETPHKIYFNKSLTAGKALEIFKPAFEFSFEDSLESSYSDSSSSSSSESLSSLSSLKTKEEIAHEMLLMRLTDPDSFIPGSLPKIELSYVPNEKKPTEIGELTFRFDSSTLKDKFMDMMKEAGLLQIFTSQSDLSVSVAPSKDKASEAGSYIAQNGEVAINFVSKEKAEFFKQKVFGSILQGVAVIYKETPHKMYFNKSFTSGKTLEIFKPAFEFSFEDSLGSSYSDSSSSSSSESLSPLMSSTLSTGSLDSSSTVSESSFMGENVSHSEDSDS